MKFLNWLGAESGTNEESLGDAVLAGIGCLILVPTIFFCLTLIANMGVTQ